MIPVPNNIGDLRTQPSNSSLCQHYRAGTNHYTQLEQLLQSISSRPDGEFLQQKKAWLGLLIEITDSRSTHKEPPATFRLIVDADEVLPARVTAVAYRVRQAQAPTVAPGHKAPAHRTHPPITIAHACVVGPPSVAVLVPKQNVLESGRPAAAATRRSMFGLSCCGSSHLREGDVWAVDMLVCLICC